MCSLLSRISEGVSSHVVGAMPYWTVSSRKANKALTWIGKRVSSPQNRLILGVTALMSQPFIDLHNKKVDEDTRKISAARTVAKIIAGTTTGFLIRYGCIKAIDYCTMLPSKITASTKFPKLRTLFTPNRQIVKYLMNNLSHHKKALGTIISLGVMVFTNFMIDAPLTKFLTNKFVDKYGLKKNDVPNKPTNPFQSIRNSTYWEARGLKHE